MINKKRFHIWLDAHAGWILSLPAIVFIFIFVIFPLFFCFVSSFTNQSVQTMFGAKDAEWIGLNHYQSLFKDKTFWQSLKNTVCFALMVVPLQTVLALILALYVNGSQIWQKCLKVTLFLPVVTSMSVLSIIWLLLYNPNYGLFNFWLQQLGLSKQAFLDSPSQALACLACMSIWQGVGFQMMIFLAGLQTIPPEMYEIFDLDSHSEWKKLKHITLPFLKNTSIFVVFITTIFAFKLFVQPHLMTRGGPQGATQTLIYLLYEESFIHGRFGKASSIAIVFFIIVFVGFFIQKIFLRSEKGEC